MTRRPIGQRFGKLRSEKVRGVENLVLKHKNTGTLDDVQGFTGQREGRCDKEHENTNAGFNMTLRAPYRT